MMQEEHRPDIPEEPKAKPPWALIGLSAALVLSLAFGGWYGVTQHSKLSDAEAAYAHQRTELDQTKSSLAESQSDLDEMNRQLSGAQSDLTTARNAVGEARDLALKCQTAAKGLFESLGDSIYDRWAEAGVHLKAVGAEYKACANANVYGTAWGN